MKLVLDEHFSAMVATQLRERGYDVVAVTERSDLRHLPDEELLRWAERARRVLLTENVRDFMPLHRFFLNRGETHCGILFTSPRKFPRRTAGIGHLVRALVVVLDSQPREEFLRGDIAWL